MNEIIAIAGGILVVALGLAVAIGLHELGHYLPAKKFGVYVPRFMVGFGPTLFSRQLGETEFGIKALPLGGYVRLVGMTPTRDELGEPRPTKNRLVLWYRRVVDKLRYEEKVEELAPGRQAFHQLPAGKKIIIMAGGPLVNLLLALFFAAVSVFWVGTPVGGTVVSSVNRCVGEKLTCDKHEESIAYGAGVKAGDEVLRVNGKAVSDTDGIISLLEKSTGKSIPIIVLREGKEVTLTAYSRPEKTERLANGGRSETWSFGVWAEAVYRPGSWSDLWDFASNTVMSTINMIVRLPQQTVEAGSVIVGAEERDPNGAASVVGLASVAGQVASGNKGDWNYTFAIWLRLLASLNFALFAFNMIPLPPLDGGHIATAIYQKLKQLWARARGKSAVRPVDTSMLTPFTLIGWVAIMLMSLIFITQDIVAPLQLG